MSQADKSLTTTAPKAAAGFAASSEDTLSSEEIRWLLYQVAAEAHLASLAIRSLEDADENETLLALNSLMHRWKDHLEHVAGGYTFDRLSRIEEMANQVSDNGPSRKP